MTTPKPPVGNTQPVTIDLCAAAREAHLDGPVGVLWKEPNPGEFWRHFKGGIYRIVSLATVEATKDRVVVYTGESGTWTRPLSEFLGDVSRDGYVGPRFVPAEVLHQRELEPSGSLLVQLSVLLWAREPTPCGSGGTSSPLRPVRRPAGRNTPMAKQSRRGQVRACGHIWYPWNDGVATMVGDKFEVTTWQFGSIHQSKVFVLYPGSKDPMDRDRIGVCLAPGKTRKEAMQRGLDWVAAYKAPDSPDELFPKLFRRWRTLYRTRVDIIDHLFFVIGNGYSWMDGAMVPTSDDDDEGERPVEVPPPGSPKYMSDEYFKLPREAQRVIDNAHYHAREEAMPIGPLPDNGAPRNFYPVCQYSDILCIPDDVRPDWLLVAYEAALMLRDRQTTTPERPEDVSRCLKNIEYGTRVVAELEAKYPHLIQGVAT